MPKRPLHVLRRTSLTSHCHLHPVLFCCSSFLGGAHGTHVSAQQVFRCYIVPQKSHELSIGYSICHFQPLASVFFLRPTFENCVPCRHAASVFALSCSFSLQYKTHAARCYVDTAPVSLSALNPRCSSFERIQKT